MPCIFWFWASIWRVAGGYVAIQRLCLLLIAITLALAYRYASPRLGTAASLAVALGTAGALPFVTGNLIFFPELWAGLLMLFAVVSWLSGWRVPADCAGRTLSLPAELVLPGSWRS